MLKHDALVILGEFHVVVVLCLKDLFGIKEVMSIMRLQRLNLLPKRLIVQQYHKTKLATSFHIQREL